MSHTQHPSPRPLHLRAHAPRPDARDSRETAMEEVFLLCSWQEVHDIAQAFTDQFKNEHAPAMVLAHSSTNKRAVGYIVIAWDERADDHFLQQVDINPALLDYAVYEVPLEEE